MTTAADRVAAFVEAFMANPYRHGHPAILTIAGEATDHKDLSLDANDVAQVVTPELRLVATMRTITGAEEPPEGASRYGAANDVLGALDLDEKALEDLAERLDQLEEALRLSRDRVGMFLYHARRRRREAEERARNPRPRTYPDGINWND